MWTDAEEKASHAYRLFIKTFEFKESEVEVCTDWSKARIIEKFDQIQTIVDEHEETSNEDIMLVSVVWIGHCLFMEKGDYHEYMKEDLLKKDSKTQACVNDIEIFKQFGLTTKGEPVQVYEYVTRLATGPNTHVLKLLDSSLKDVRMLKKEHVDGEA